MTEPIQKLLTKIVCSNVATVIRFDSDRINKYPCIKTYNGTKSVLTELFDDIVNGNSFDIETISQLTRSLLETKIVTDYQFDGKVKITYVSFPKLIV